VTLSMASIHHGLQNRLRLFNYADSPRIRSVSRHPNPGMNTADREDSFNFLEYRQAQLCFRLAEGPEDENEGNEGQSEPDIPPQMPLVDNHW